MTSSLHHISLNAVTIVVYVLEYAIYQDKEYCCLIIISPIDKKQHKLNLI